MSEAEKTTGKKNKTVEKMKMMKEERCTRKRCRCMKEKKRNEKRERERVEKQGRKGNEFHR